MSNMFNEMLLENLFEEALEEGFTEEQAEQVAQERVENTPNPCGQVKQEAAGTVKRLG